MLRRVLIGVLLAPYKAASQIAPVQPTSSASASARSHRSNLSPSTPLPPPGGAFPAGGVRVNSSGSDEHPHASPAYAAASVQPHQTGRQQRFRDSGTPTQADPLETCARSAQVGSPEGDPWSHTKRLRRPGSHCRPRTLTPVLERRHRRGIHLGANARRLRVLADRPKNERRHPPSDEVSTRGRNNRSGHRLGHGSQNALLARQEDLQMSLRLVEDEETGLRRCPLAAAVIGSVCISGVGGEAWKVIARGSDNGDQVVSVGVGKDRPTTFAVRARVTGEPKAMKVHAVVLCGKAGYFGMATLSRSQRFTLADSAMRELQLPMVYPENCGVTAIGVSNAVVRRVGDTVYTGHLIMEILAPCVVQRNGGCVA
jgi:hypothetical protein